MAAGVVKFKDARDIRDAKEAIKDVEKQGAISMSEMKKRLGLQAPKQSKNTGALKKKTK